MRFTLLAVASFLLAVPIVACDTCDPGCRPSCPTAYDLVGMTMEADICEQFHAVLDQLAREDHAMLILVTNEAPSPRAETLARQIAALLRRAKAKQHLTTVEIDNALLLSRAALGVTCPERTAPQNSH